MSLLKEWQVNRKRFDTNGVRLRMQLIVKKRVTIHTVNTINSQKGISLVPALVTIFIFTVLTTQVVIPNQQRNLRDTNINAVANTAENLIQATYAFRAKNNSWPSELIGNNNSSDPVFPLPPPGSLPSAGTATGPEPGSKPTSSYSLSPDYLTHFNARNPWGYYWRMKPITNTNSMLHFETETGDEAIARALVRKIGSSAVISNNTIVKIYPAMNATPTVQGLNIDGALDIDGALSLDGDLQINGSELDLGSAKIVMRVSDKDVDITKSLTVLPSIVNYHVPLIYKGIIKVDDKVIKLTKRIEELEKSD